MTRTTRWARCSLTSSRRSRNLRLISSGCGLAKGWRSPGRTVGSKASSRNSTLASDCTCSVFTKPDGTRFRKSQSSSPSAEPPSIERSLAPAVAPPRPQQHPAIFGRHTGRCRASRATPEAVPTETARKHHGTAAGGSFKGRRMFRGERSVPGEGVLLAIFDLICISASSHGCPRLEYAVRLTDFSSLRH